MLVSLVVEPNSQRQIQPVRAWNEESIYTYWCAKISMFGRE